MAHRDRLYDGHGRFVDSTGEVSLDVSDMPLTGSFGSDQGEIDSEHAFAYSDFCLVRLENDGGGMFLTVIDKDGNQMFEPIRNGDTGLLGEEAFFFMPENGERGWYLKVDGSKLCELEGSKGTMYCEGRAWILMDDIWRCIDSKGEIVI